MTACGPLDMPTRETVNEGLTLYRVAKTKVGEEGPISGTDWRLRRRALRRSGSYRRVWRRGSARTRSRGTG